MGKNQNCFEYKGYHTRIEFDYDSLSLYGKIEGIDDLVLFESEDASEIENEFHKAVDDYLVLCEENGKEPQKEYKGVFNVRVSPEIHRKLSVIAFKSEETLNAIVEKALEEYVNGSSAVIPDHLIELPTVGEVLKEEFMEPHGITVRKLAKDLSIPLSYITEILKDDKSISADMALRLAKYFGVTESFFLDIQNDIVLRRQKEAMSEDLERIQPVQGKAV